MSSVNFQLTPTGPTTYTVNSRIGITDADGDQIIFKNVGTGKFLPGVSDPSVGGNPPFQVFGNTLGGPQSGTYQVVATTGKYTSMFSIGQTFVYRAVFYNPSSPPAGGLGSAYIEVGGQ